MAKFIFIKPYSIFNNPHNVIGGGIAQPILIKSFAVGDKIEGEVTLVPAGGGIVPDIRTVINGTPYLIPLSVVKEVYPGNPPGYTKAKSLFTPLTVILGIVLIVAVFGILKITKVI